MPYLSSKGDGSLHLSIHVQPRASRAGVCGIHGDALKLAVTSPPVDGKANKEIIAILADVLQIPRKEIAITFGLQSRTKRCRIGMLTEDECRMRLANELKRRG